MDNQSAMVINDNAPLAFWTSDFEYDFGYGERSFWR